MAYNTFSPPVNPSYGLSRDNTLRSVQLEYGDGYEQSIADGINIRERSMSIDWEMLTVAQVAAIEAFFVSQNTAPFNYTLPGESVQIWRCLEWTVVRDTPNNLKLSAKFKGVYL
ncbi:MAG: phage tail protein [Clostridia bacterium]|nr:phage tail protein [Clostridia bacterium]